MNKLMKTTRKEYTQAIRAELLERINVEGTPLEGVEPTDREKIEYLFATWSDEYGHEIKRTPNTQERLAGWLMGLPSAINLPFANWEVLEFTAKLHQIDEVPDDKVDIILANYWQHIALHLIRLYEALTGEMYRP